MKRTNTENKFAQNLQQILKSNGIRQYTIAKKVGISNSSMCRYVNGEEIPNVYTALDIAKALNIKLEKLLGE